MMTAPGMWNCGRSSLSDCQLLDLDRFFARFMGLQIPLCGTRVPEIRPVSEWQDGFCASSRERRLYQGDLCTLRWTTVFAAEPARHPVGQLHREFAQVRQRHRPFQSRTLGWHFDESRPFERLPVEPMFRAGLQGLFHARPRIAMLLGPLTNANVSMGGLCELASSVNGRLNGNREARRAS